MNAQLSEADLAALELLPPLCIDLDAARALQLLALLQLACRHPGLPARSRAFAEQLARAVEQYVAVTPNVSDVCAAGWRPAYALPADGSGPDSTILPG